MRMGRSLLRLIKRLRGSCAWIEANELKQSVGASITDIVAGWLAPQYALASRKQLAELEGERRLKLLRAFVQDWALLRHGDQSAQRLQIERERLAVSSRHADPKMEAQDHRRTGNADGLCGQAPGSQSRDG